LTWSLIICASEPRDTSLWVSSPLQFAVPCFIWWFLMRIIQIFNDSGFDRIAWTFAIAKCSHSTAISPVFIATYRISSHPTNYNPSKPPFQYLSPRFRPVRQIDLSPYPAQDTLEGDGGMAIVPLFNHASNIPVRLFLTPKTYVNNPTRGGYFDCLINPHRPLYPYDPECLCTLCILVGVDSQTPLTPRSAGAIWPYPR